MLTRHQDSLVSYLVDELLLILPMTWLYVARIKCDALAFQHLYLFNNDQKTNADPHQFSTETLQILHVADMMST